MKKSYFRVAAMVAASVLSVSSFVSCDEEEENNSFKSETFTVELEDSRSHGLITGYSSIYEWEWTNSAEAAADSIGLILEYNDESDSLSSNDSLLISIDGISRTIKEVWTFKTKEIGVRELKFRKLRIYSGPMGIEENLDELRRRAKEDPTAVIADTVVKF